MDSIDKIANELSRLNQRMDAIIKLMVQDRKLRTETKPGEITDKEENLSIGSTGFFNEEQKSEK